MQAEKTGEGAGGTLPQPAEGQEKGLGPPLLQGLLILCLCKFEWGLCSGSQGHSKLEGKLEKLFKKTPP